MRVSPRALLAGLVLVLCATPAGARKKGKGAPRDAFERCQAAEADFDYETVLSECALAAAEPNRSVDDRVQIFQLLGFAHIALGDAEKGEVWFLRLLSLKPDHELPETASPVYRQVFEDTKKQFLEEGRIKVSHEPPARFDGKASVRFVVEDRLSRVASARLDVEARDGDKTLAQVSVALTKGGTEDVLTTYGGDVLDPAPAAGPHTLQYTLVLTDAEGAPLDVDPPFVPVRLDAAGTRGPGPDEDESPGWLVPTVAGGAAVGAVVVVVAVAGVATTVVCLTTSLCRVNEPRATSHIGLTKVQVDTGSE